MDRYYIEFRHPVTKERRYVSTICAHTVLHSKDRKRALLLTDREMSRNPAYFNDSLRWGILPGLKQMGVRLKDIRVLIADTDPNACEMVPYWDIFVDWKR